MRPYLFFACPFLLVVFALYLDFDVAGIKSLIPNVRCNFNSRARLYAHYFLFAGVILHIFLFISIFRLMFHLSAYLRDYFHHLLLNFDIIDHFTIIYCYILQYYQIKVILTRQFGIMILVYLSTYMYFCMPLPYVNVSILTVISRKVR